MFGKRSKTKRGITACALIFLSSVSSLPLPTANAIFGLSTCEKLKTSINSRDDIGYALWKNYDSTWKLHVKNPNDTAIDTQVVDGLSNLYKLHLSVLAMAMEPPNCFNPAQNADIISWQSGAKRNLAVAQSWLNPNNLM